MHFRPDDDACGEQITVVEADESRDMRPCGHVLPCPWHGGRYDAIVASISQHVSRALDHTIAPSAALELIRTDVHLILHRRDASRRAS